MVGAIARVMVTFYTKVVSNFPSEPKSRPTKKTKVSSKIGVVAG